MDGSTGKGRRENIDTTPVDRILDTSLTTVHVSRTSTPVIHTQHVMKQDSYRGTLNLSPRYIVNALASIRRQMSCSRACFCRESTCWLMLVRMSWIRSRDSANRRRSCTFDSERINRDITVTIRESTHRVQTPANLCKSGLPCWTFVHAASSNHEHCHLYLQTKLERHFTISSLTDSPFYHLFINWLAILPSLH